jgi:hypothetical protein
VVTCVQINDGVVQVEYLIPPPVEGWTDQQLLEWKAERHQAAGWTVEWGGGRRSFDATVTRPASDRQIDPDAILSKQRTFRRAG